MAMFHMEHSRDGEGRGTARSPACLERQRDRCQHRSHNDPIASVALRVSLPVSAARREGDATLDSEGTLWAEQGLPTGRSGR